MSDVTTVNNPSILSSASIAPGEIVVGMLTAFADGNPLVSYRHSGYSQQSAISAVELSPHDIGRQVALLFVNGDIKRPMIIGLIHGSYGEFLDDCAQNDPSLGDCTLTPAIPVQQSDSMQTLHVDGKKIVIEGETEIVLQCGESSITLSNNGKIEIRGKYLVSRASGVNRIVGAQVNVN